MYLLDTHALIWFLGNAPELSPTADGIICSSADVSVSYVSLWEMAIKRSLGKLRFPQTFGDIVHICSAEHIRLIGITGADLDVLDKLPFIHRDPFDRLLIAQAILTKEKAFPLRGRLFLS